MEFTRSSGISDDVRRTACTLNDCNVGIYPDKGASNGHPLTLTTAELIRSVSLLPFEIDRLQLVLYVRVPFRTANLDSETGSAVT